MFCKEVCKLSFIFQTQIDKLCLKTISNNCYNIYYVSNNNSINLDILQHINKNKKIEDISSDFSKIHTINNNTKTEVHNFNKEDKYLSNERNFFFNDKVTDNKLNLKEFSNWFHNFLKNYINKIIHKECDKRINNLKSMIKAVSGKSFVIINDNDYNSGITNFKWDCERKGEAIEIDNNGETLILDESCYAFRTVVGNTPFNSGVHYWEITADRRTENELKVGVTKNINMNYDTSFSDYNFGWAFYGIGQLRHSNNATGENYGKKFKKSGTLGVFLDMNRVN